KGARFPGAARTKKRGTKRVNGDAITQALPEHRSALRFCDSCKLKLGAAEFLQGHPVAGNFHLVNCSCERCLDFDSIFVAEFVPATHIPDYDDTSCGKFPNDCI